MNNPVKQAIKENRCTIGTWVTIPHPTVTEILADAGFDWLTLDTEHAAIDVPQGQACFQSIQATSCVPFVRVPHNDIMWIRRFLDVGAMGIIVPLVNTPEEAAAAVEVAKYPPVGKRGIGLMRANRYGTTAEEYLAEANDEIVVIAQIEHIRGVENVEAIANTPGIDGLFIGPYDLSGSMGLLGQFDHPRLQEAIDRICKAAVDAKIAPGLHVVQPSVDEMKARIDAGFRFIAFSVDFLFLQNCRPGIESFRKISKEI
jgi:2-dehydro-3-deoxyglucarate aldolase